MELFAIGLLGAMSLASSKAFDVVKLFVSGKTRDGITLVLAFAVAIGVALLGASTDFADGVKVGGIVFGELNAASVVFLGILAGGSGSFAYDRWSRNTPSIGDQTESASD